MKILYLNPFLINFELSSSKRDKHTHTDTIMRHHINWFNSTDGENVSYIEK